MKKLKLLSLFSGIGAFEKALDNLSVPYELVNYCEIDKFASKSYAAIHNVEESMNLGDITKVNEKELPKDIDLITYGFPCQDISLAGKQKGLFNEDGTQTRSGLFFEALRIIEETKPRVAIAENVKNLVGKKFKPQFEIVLNSLEQAGYNNYWKVLNGKNYGIPQNRERVFIVSIRKDIDNGNFEFPEGFPLQLRLKDMLEDEVDEKYYISTDRASLLIQKLIETNQIQDERVCCDSTINDPKVREISNCITSRYDAGIQNQKQIGLCVVEPQPILFGGMQKNQSIKQDGISTTLTSSMGNGGGYVPMVTEPKRLGGLYDTDTTKHQAGAVWDKDCISPTIDTMQGGNRQPCVLVNDNLHECTDKLIQVGNLAGGKWDKINESCRRVYSQEGIAPTLHTCQGGNTEPKVLVREATKKGYAEVVEGDSINFEQPNSKTRRGRVGHGIAQTLTTSPQQGVVINEPTLNKIEIPQIVKVRKYEVDTKKLCNVLRDAKDKVFETVYGISEVLNVPQTKVAHWFRTDDSFAIPDADIWLKLKELLKIETDEFDEAIMTFEEKEGVYEKSERHYFADGIAPTLTSTSAGNEKFIIQDNVQQNNFSGGAYLRNFGSKGKLQNVSDVCDTLQAAMGTGGGNVPIIAEIKQENDSNEQKSLEKSSLIKEVCDKAIYNNLVQPTDVIECSYANTRLKEIEQGYIKKQNSNDNNIMSTLVTNSQKLGICVDNPLRIRKLTPKECFALMGFDETDFLKAEKVNSNTQLYKQAGNSIIVNVLYYILKNLIDSNIL